MASYGGVGQADKSYWAGFDAKDLVKRLQKKREDFLEFFDQSNYFDRVYRNWAYYHGLNYAQAGSNTEIRIAGKEGELRLLAINEFRSNISLLKTYITEGEVEWDAIATGDGAAALNAAKKVNSFLDGAVQSNDLDVGRVLDNATEDSLILTAGYAWNLWDQNHGRPTGVVGSGKNRRFKWSGEVRCLNPSMFDVVFDYTVRNFHECAWVEVRRQENKWDLAAEYASDKKKREAVLRDEHDEYNKKYRKFDFRLPSEELTTRDHRWVYYFYHKPCPALPTGRFLRRIFNHPLEDEMMLPDGHIPVSRIIPAQFMLTPFGFTPAFSAQAPQEALNAAESTRVTAENALGPPKIWKRKGEPLNRAQLEPGITVLECETKPEPINFYQLSPELRESVDLYMNQVQRAIGTNETARGSPEPNIKSGAAMAFTEQRVTQAASDLVKNRRRFLSDFGTSLAKVYAHRLQGSRPIEVRQSITDRAQTIELTPEEFQAIKTVSVIPGNPAMRTLGGRIQVAEILLEKQAVRPDEFVTVLKTGKLDKIMEAEDNQLQLIAEENDALFKGEEHVAMPHHNHMLHIRRHLSEADSENGRRYPEIGDRYRAAALQHKEFLTYVDPAPVPLIDPITGQPAVNPMTGQIEIDQEATQSLQQKAAIVQQSIDYNKLLGYLPPDFVPFGAPAPPPGMGAPPPQPLNMTAMGTPPAAQPGGPAPQGHSPRGGASVGAEGGPPQLVGGVSDRVLQKINNGSM